MSFIANFGLEDELSTCQIIQLLNYLCMCASLAMPSLIVLPTLITFAFHCRAVISNGYVQMNLDKIKSLHLFESDTTTTKERYNLL